MYLDLNQKTLPLAEGCHLSYRVDAKGTDTTIMLIHGALCDASTLWHVAPADQNRFNIVLPDLRGHGDSTGGNGSWSLDDLAGDLIAVANAEHAGRLILAGESFGALVAARMAALIPERVAWVVCSEPPLTPARLFHVRSALLSARQSGVNPAVEGLAKILGYVASEDEAQTAEFTFHALLSEIPAPVIVLHGTGGTGAFASVIDEEDRTRLAEMSSVRMVAVQGADHLVLRSIGSSLFRALLLESMKLP